MKPFKVVPALLPICRSQSFGLLSGILTALLVGCAGSSVNSESSAESAVPEMIVDSIPPTGEKKISGRLFAFDENRAGEVVSAETLKQIKGTVRKQMLELGYQEADLPRKAHLTLHLYSDRYSAVEEDVKSMGVPTSATAVADFARMARFNVTIFLNEYGKRPQNYSYVTFTSLKSDWLGLEEKLVTSVAKELPKLIVKAPEKDLQKKGDPGCYPRFGYIPKDGVVTAVPKGSAAAEAGIQVGDVVESIDSRPEAVAIADAEIYEKRLKVPVRLKRAGQIVRTTIQAKITCD